MRPPHWLDEVIGDNRDVNAIVNAIANSAELKNRIQIGIGKGIEFEEQVKQNPHHLGSSFQQEVRVAIVDQQLE